MEDFVRKRYKLAGDWIEATGTFWLGGLRAGHARGEARFICETARKGLVANGAPEAFWVIYFVQSVQLSRKSIDRLVARGTERFWHTVSVYPSVCRYVKLPRRYAPAAGGT